MKQNYKLSYQIIALVSLILFLLESCHNNITPIALQEKDETEEINHLPLQRADLSRKEESQYIPGGGHLVSFCQELESKTFKASVEENLPTCFRRIRNSLPAYISDEINLSDIANKNQAEQKKVIEGCLPKSDQPGHVYISKRGLLRDMKRKVRGSEKGEKDEKSEGKASIGRISKDQNLLIAEFFREEATRLGYLRVLPIELLQMILSYVPFPYILDVIKVNHTFYELITGYTKVGLIGVENRPNSVFHCNSWLSEKQINFKTQSPESVPSRLFYCFIGNVSNVSEALWPYLQDSKIYTLHLTGNLIDALRAQALAKALPDTEIRTLNLWINHIGALGAQALAKVLPDTNIHMLHLGGNQIGDQGAEALAKALPDTEIHTLDLRNNEISAEGAGALAKALPSTNIHTLDLRNNQIGTEGAKVLAKALPGTKIHTLNLWKNQIGEEGAQALAKALPDTQIHTLDLESNRIGARGAEPLAKVLSNTQIHTLNLACNQIGRETEDLLKIKFPHIKFEF